MPEIGIDLAGFQSGLAVENDTQIMARYCAGARAVFRAQLVAYCGDDLVQCRLVPGEKMFLRQPDGQQIRDSRERCDAIIAATRAAIRIRQEFDDILRGRTLPK
jgi:hypothetical protein